MAVESDIIVVHPSKPIEHIRRKEGMLRESSVMRTDSFHGDGDSGTEYMGHYCFVL